MSGGGQLAGGTEASFHFPNNFNAVLPNRAAAQAFVKRLEIAIAVTLGMQDSRDLFVVSDLFAGSIVVQLVFRDAEVVDTLS